MLIATLIRILQWQILGYTEAYVFCFSIILRPILFSLLR